MLEIKGKDRIWLMAGGFAAVLIVAVGWLFFISSEKSDASNYREQLSNAQTQALVIHRHLNTLKADNANLAQFKQQLAVDQAALPSTTDIQSFLRQLQAGGVAAHVTVTSISAAQPLPVTPAANGSSTSSDDTSTSSSSTSSGATAVATEYEIGIVVNVTGNLTDLTAFVQQLQQTQPRAVLISGVSQVPSGTGAGVELMTVTLKAFVAPPAADGTTATK